jgi:hypothetical protein
MGIRALLTNPRQTFDSDRIWASSSRALFRRSAMGAHTTLFKRHCFCAGAVFSVSMRESAGAALGTRL